MQVIERIVGVVRTVGYGAPHRVVISAVIAVLCLLFTGAESLPAAEEDWGLETLLENRPLSDHEDLNRHFRDLKDASIEEIEKELRVMEKEKKIAHENWERLPSVRRSGTAAAGAAEVRAATMTISLWQAERTRKAMLEQLHEREREAYERKFGRILNGKYGITPKRRKNWRGTAEYTAFRQAENEIEERFLEETARIARKAREGSKEREEALDRTRDEVLLEYIWVSEAVQWLKEAIERKRLDQHWVAWEEVERKQAEDELRSGLRLVPSTTNFTLEAGDPKVAWFNVYRGAPPYYLIVNEASHGTRDIAIDKPGFTMLPFSFNKPGTYIARAAVYDDHGAHREVDLTFNVTGKEPVPEEEKKKDEAKEETTEEKRVEEAEGNLVATGIWPLEPLRITVGQSQKFQLMGVYAENVFDAVDVSYKTTWQASPALEWVKPGTCLAREPGTYSITGSIKKDDEWMTVTTVIEVTNRPDDNPGIVALATPFPAS